MEDPPPPRKKSGCGGGSKTLTVSGGGGVRGTRGDLGVGGLIDFANLGSGGLEVFKNSGGGVFPNLASFNGTALMHFSGVKAFLIAILGDIGSYQMTMNRT